MNLACQACKKRPATVHLTDITPEGEMQERHLCEECAQEEGLTPKPPTNVPLNAMLAGMIMDKAAIQQLAELKCPHCGLTFVEFRNAGLLGCPGDYDAFEKALVPLIERAHENASHHIGKVPQRLAVPRSAESDLIRLRRELTKAVDDEQYEQAAKLRDRIKALETQ
ncbi:MAG TPA: UvrB/UvrC motif-containing protein [Phycisphaerae bacterium]|nr:UvrB/UvrC motif-containing protein [Phycisphaerae bacterium]